MTNAFQPIPGRNLSPGGKSQRYTAMDDRLENLRELLRAVFCSSLWQPRIEPGIPDEELYSFLDAGYRARKKEQEDDRANAHQEPPDRNFGLFPFAAGLVLFGRLDVAEDIADGLPPTGKIRRLSWCLRALLPLPPGHDPQIPLEEVLDWLRLHRDELVWNPATGRYEFAADHQPED